VLAWHLTPSLCGFASYNPGHHAVDLILQTGLYDIFQASTLATFLVVYFLLAVVTAGISMPSGLVIPMMTIGSGTFGLRPPLGFAALREEVAFWHAGGALGRLWGVLVNELIKKPSGAILSRQPARTRAACCRWT
jgi:hypothetical protein